MSLQAALVYHALSARFQAECSTSKKVFSTARKPSDTTVQILTSQIDASGKLPKPFPGSHKNGGATRLTCGLAVHHGAKLSVHGACDCYSNATAVYDTDVGRPIIIRQGAVGRQRSAVALYWLCCVVQQGRPGSQNSHLTEHAFSGPYL